MARRQTRGPYAGVVTPTVARQARTHAHRDPSGHDRETPVWRFSIVDREGPWGWRNRAGPDWWNEILPKLQSFESMTWAEIIRAAGGRTRGNNSHFVLVEELTRRARDRLAEIGQEDLSDLFSLRLTATTRIYGVRDGRVLKLLWYDPDHGDNSRSVCPVRSR